MDVSYYTKTTDEYIEIEENYRNAIKDLDIENKYYPSSLLFMAFKHANSLGRNMTALLCYFHWKDRPECVQDTIRLIKYMMKIDSRAVNMSIILH